MPSETPEDSGVGGTGYSEVRQLTRQMRDQLSRWVKELSVEEYILARRFLESSWASLALQLPEFKPVFAVEIQDLRRHATHGAAAHDERALPCEVLVPGVAPWVEQLGQSGRLRVDPGEVASLVQVAGNARQCKVLKIVIPSVLSGTDVLDL